MEKSDQSEYMQKSHSEEEEEEKSAGKIVVDVGQFLNYYNNIHFVTLWQENRNPISNIEDAREFIEDMNVDLIQISTKTTEKALDRQRVTSELTNLKEEDRRLIDRVSWRKKTLNTLYLALDKLCFESNAYWGREIEYTGSMEKQIDNHKLNFQMQHGSKSLAKEKKILREIHMCQQSDDSSNFLLKELANILISLKWRYHNIEKNCEQLLREIKEFELAREKAIDNVAVMGKIWSSVGLREAMRNQVKMILD